MKHAVDAKSSRLLELYFRLVNGEVLKKADLAQQYHITERSVQRDIVSLAEKYMSELGRGIDTLSNIKLSDGKVMKLMEEFFPVTSDLSDTQRNNNQRLLEDLKMRYWDAPDLSNVGKNGYRFINAVSDFATHADPIRKTRNYSENLFLRTVEGNPLIDRAYKMVLAAA